MERPERNSNTAQVYGADRYTTGKGVTSLAQSLPAKRDNETIVLRKIMGTISIRRLSDKTLEKYQKIIESGEELTPRQKKALEGHALIINSDLVEALLRPDKKQASD